MRSDPRCPACDGKVSATAEWCMHCGTDFDRPVDRAKTDGWNGGMDTFDGSDGTDYGTTATEGRGSAGGEGTTTRDAVGEELGAILGSNPSGADQSGSADGSTGETRYPTAERSGSAIDPSGTGLFRAVADHAVDYVAADESRREAIAVGVPALIWLLVGGSLEPSGIGLLGAGALVLFLHSRESARETLAASAYGGALLVVVLDVVDAVLAVTDGGGAVSLTVAVADLLAWSPVLIGAFLFGLWIRRSGD